MKTNLLLTYTLVFLGSLFSINAQDNLLSTLESEFPSTTQYEIATFKGTRISIGQSIENKKKGVFQLIAQNRYWNLPNSEEIQSFVADKASTRFALEYAFTDNLTAGGGWTSLDDVSNAYLKFNLLRQTKNTKKSPISITLFQNASYKGDRSVASSNVPLEDRLAFTSQILIAHKFNQYFSLQISPTFIHRTFALSEDPNNHFALGFGGRYRVGKHVSLVSEYYYVANPLKSEDTYGAFAIGVNWDVRFLLLQFQMTNTRSMVEDDFILQTSNNFNTEDGNFVFGFNAIFNLHFKKNKL